MAPPKHVALLGVNSMAAFENLKWWTLGKGQAAKYAAEASLKPDRIDVFGVGRQAEALRPHPCGPEGVEHLEEGQPIWLHFPPLYYDRVANNPNVGAVVVSGRAGADAKVVLDALRAGKAVFVESVEHFDAATMDTIAQLAGAADAPAFMTGLYQRFDVQLAQLAKDGVANRVGRPLLYQAHASSLSDSLFDLGMQHVDAVRLLMGSEPMEVFAAGDGADLSRCQVLALTLRLANGVVASLALDRSGTAAKERVLVVGDQSRAEFEADMVEKHSISARVLRLQKAGVNHFMQVALDGAQPRVALADVLRARQVMLAAEESLRSGRAVALGEGAARAEGAASWVAQVASKTGEAASKAVGKVAALASDTISAHPADTPPRAQRKGAHLGIGTSTPDSPEPLAAPPKA